MGAAARTAAAATAGGSASAAAVAAGRLPAAAGRAEGAAEEQMIVRAMRQDCPPSAGPSSSAATASAATVAAAASTAISRTQRTNPTGLMEEHAMMDMPELPETLALEVMAAMAGQRGLKRRPDRGADDGPRTHRARVEVSQVRVIEVGTSLKREPAAPQTNPKRRRRDVRVPARPVAGTDLEGGGWPELPEEEAQKVKEARLQRGGEGGARRGTKRRGGALPAEEPRRRFGRRYTGVANDPVDAADSRGHHLKITGAVIWCSACGSHAARRLGKALKAECPGAVTPANATRLARLREGLHPLTGKPLLHELRRRGRARGLKGRDSG